MTYQKHIYCQCQADIDLDIFPPTFNSEPKLSVGLWLSFHVGLVNPKVSDMMEGVGDAETILHE